ncbi:DUF4231 domain-containing protein [Frankia sp. R43]|uniref:DUF4231 domain-containing protein n=1 Tax=Frankia sp. R43 TaxID=269536 RepID=UPI0009F84346|nr:DUF4231 domain-containing protein [Frankia sp. R43]
MDARDSDFALRLANDSYDWYRTHAIRSRKRYRQNEILLLCIAAAIPTSAVIAPKNPAVPSIMGALIVVMSGIRTIFHWHDNYLRYSYAREAVEAERRLYRTESAPYDDPRTRMKLLAAKVTNIEHDEMAEWIKISSDLPKISGGRQDGAVP